MKKNRAATSKRALSSLKRQLLQIYRRMDEVQAEVHAYTLRTTNPSSWNIREFLRDGMNLVSIARKNLERAEEALPHLEWKREINSSGHASRPPD
jgi:hypothetical protein